MRKPFHMRKKWQDYHATHCQQGPDPDCLVCHPEGRPINQRRFVMANNVIMPGTQTQWGKVAAVGFRDGERYYMMVDKRGTVALMPANVVESAMVAKDSLARAPGSPVAPSVAEGQG